MLKVVLALAFFVALVGQVACASPSSPSKGPGSPSSLQVPTTDGGSPVTTGPGNNRAAGIQARVTRVIDGDTIEVSLNGTTQRVRYIGMDTPETVDPNRPVGCFGKEASDRNKQLVEGKTAYLEKDVSETDRYGRLLRYVYLENGDMVNEVLVTEGFAQVATFPPDVKNQQRFLDAQKQAREANRGLWGACQAGAAPTAKPAVQATTGAPPPSAAGSCPQGCSVAPAGCAIKGNISSSGEKIYHVPGGGSYNATVITANAGERWFCTEQEAQNNGWRKAQN